MIRLWRARPWLTSAFLLACAVTLFFAVRLGVQAVYWQTHQEVPVEPWMTVRYVARSWGVEPPALGEAAGLPLPEVKGHPLPLIEIARERGVPVSEVIEDVQRAIEVLRAAEAVE